jgi:UDP-3-O-[3-hydroxymyristoyl] glucosamine N-acyltransferase
LPNELSGYAKWLNEIKALARFGHAGNEELCFCDRLPIPGYLQKSNLSTVLCNYEINHALAEQGYKTRNIVINDPRSSFIDIARQVQNANAIDVTSCIPHPLGISPSVRIGSHSFVHPEVRIDDDVVIGSNCIVHKGSWLQRGVAIGDGTVIGSTGINAYRSNDGRILDFPHLAGLIIGKNTQIGSNCVLVRGILTSTAIEESVVIGNLCNIGHGVNIKKMCWISAGCIIGGHAHIGEKANLGVGALIRDNLNIGKRAQIGMGTVVVRNVQDKSSIFGNPARSVPNLKAGPER